jgi:ketosteroid isomerase-like protein
MKFLITLFLTSLLSNAYSQQAEQEINEQVWKPFTKAILTQDVAAFIALHSKEVIRVERNDKRILRYEEYKAGMEKGWPGWAEYNKKNNIAYTFELRFLERIATNDQAFEVGYFKNESTNPDGKKRTSYGQFHVALRKEDGSWKILVDSDSNLGGSITEEMFMAAKPIE